MRITHFVKAILLTVIVGGLFLSCTKKSMMVTQIDSEGSITFADGSQQKLPSVLRTDTVATVFLVRHAEKANDGTPDPPLTAEGEQRALRLAQILGKVPIHTVAFTPYKRTGLTLNPLMQQQGMPNVTYTPEVQNQAIVSMIKEGRGENYVVAGHQNSIPALLNYLSGSTRFADIPDHEFGNLYVVIFRKVGDADVLELKY